MRTGTLVLTSLFVVSLSSVAFARGTTSATASPSNLSTTVAADGTISGDRSTTISITHSDPASGLFDSCEGIRSVGVYDTSAAPYVRQGLIVLSKTLCNFNASDAHVDVFPMTDAELRSTCLGVTGVKTITKPYRAFLFAQNLLGVLTSGAIWTGRPYTDLAVTQTVTCAAAPTSASTGSTANVHGAAPIPGGTSGGTSSSGTSSPTPAGQSPTVGAPPSIINPATVATLSVTKVGTKPAPMTLDDAALQSWFAFTLPSEEMASANSAYASLGPAYATFSSAAAAYQTKLTACKAQPITANDIQTYCAASDSLTTCSIKLVDRCVAPEKTAMLNARAAVSTAAGALSAVTH